MYAPPHLASSPSFLTLRIFFETFLFVVLPWPPLNGSVLAASVCLSLSSHSFIICLPLPYLLRSLQWGWMSVINISVIRKRYVSDCFESSGPWTATQPSPLNALFVLATPMLQMSTGITNKGRRPGKNSNVIYPNGVNKLLWNNQGTPERLDTPNMSGGSCKQKITSPTR